ncbi:excitatory amino acid transporter-like isoform X2 [Ornithodoros turicata]|uniref:excitatory amino acid transporter-like isoform X2 n=1 Tax=Ornithodoros turicata TaxID=34597 RepID=UPI00313A03D3
MESNKPPVTESDDGFQPPNDSLSLLREEVKKKTGSRTQSAGTPEPVPHKRKRHKRRHSKSHNESDFPLSPPCGLSSEDDSSGPVPSPFPLLEPNANRAKRPIGDPGYTPFSSLASPSSTPTDGSPQKGPIHDLMPTPDSPWSEFAKREGGHRDSLERRHKATPRASAESPPMLALSKKSKKNAKKRTEEPFDTDYVAPKHSKAKVQRDSLTKMPVKQKLLRTPDVEVEDGDASKAAQDKPVDEGSPRNTSSKQPESPIGPVEPQAAAESPGQPSGARRKTFPFGIIGRRREKRTSLVADTMDVTPPDRHRCKMFLKKFTEHLMLGLLFGGIGGGLALGHALRLSGIVWKSREIMYLAFPGELLLRMLASVSLPFMISSVIAAMGSLQPRVLARIGAWTLLLWVATKVMAVMVAISVAAVLKPGMGEHDIKIPPRMPRTSASVLVVDKALDILRNLFPSNVLEACVYTTFTKIELSSEVDLRILANSSAVDKLSYSVVRDTRPNQMGLLTFCILIGGVLSVVHEQHNAVLNFFVSLSNAVMIVTQVIMWYSPIGVCCLVASYVVSEPTFVWQLDPLWAALGVALAVHGIFVLPFVYAVFVRSNCSQFFFSALPPIAVSFGTGSNWRSMPVAVSTLEDNAGLEPRLRYRLHLDIVDYALLGTVSVLGSMTKASVGSDIGSIFLFVLEAAGMPTMEVQIIYLLHWAFYLLATAVNTLGNAVSAAVVQSLCANALTSEESPEDGRGNDNRNEESIIGQ